MTTAVVYPFTPSVRALAEGFSQIENHHIQVAEIRIHPEDVETLMCLFRPGGQEAELPPPSCTQGEDIVGYLWGAVLRKDFTILRDRPRRLKLVSETRLPLEPIIVWV